MSKENDEPQSGFRAGVPGWSAEVGSRLGELYDAVGGLAGAGRITGVSPDALANWRDGKARPAFYPLVALCHSAGFSLDWLASGRGAKQFSAQAGAVPAEASISARLSKTVDLTRMADAYGEALTRTERVKNPDHYRVMEITLMMYDAMTSAEEAISQALGKGRSSSAPD